MTKPVATTGTGMTERTVIGFDPMSAADLNVLIAAGKETLDRTSFQRLSLRLTADAARILAQSGLPMDAGGIYALDDNGKWHRREGEFGPGTELGVESLPLSVLVQSMGFAHDTPEGYAANALMLLGRATRQLGAASLDEAMATAFDLGMLVTEASMKDIFEVDYLTGGRVRAVMREAHTKQYGTAEDRQERDDAICLAIERELANNGRDRMRSYSVVAKKLRVSISTVQRALRSKT